MTALEEMRNWDIPYGTDADEFRQWMVKRFDAILKESL